MPSSTANRDQADPTSIAADQRVRLPRGERTTKKELVLELARGKRVLHVGACDSPYWRERIASRTFLHAEIERVAGECVGVDVATDAIRALRESFGIDTIHECEPYAIADLGLEPFDLVVAADVIEHVSDAGEFIRDLSSQLAGDGSLLITTVNAFCVRRLIKLLLGREVNHPDHVAYYSYSTLRQLLAREEFTIERVYGYSSSAPAPWTARLIDRGSLLVSPYASDGIAVLARKRARDRL